MTPKTHLILQQILELVYIHQGIYKDRVRHILYREKIYIIYPYEVSTHFYLHLQTLKSKISPCDVSPQNTFEVIKKTRINVKLVIVVSLNYKSLHAI
jgi:hypothetical protein